MAPLQISTGYASWLRYCTDVVPQRSTKLCTTFGRLLHWYTIYRPTLTEFCQVQSSLCVQVLRSPILAALLHGTRAVGVSHTLRRGARNGITELSLLVLCHNLFVYLLRAVFCTTIFGRAAITWYFRATSSSCFLFVQCELFKQAIVIDSFYRKTRKKITYTEHLKESNSKIPH